MTESDRVAEAEILFRPGTDVDIVSRELTDSGWRVHLRER